MPPTPSTDTTYPVVHFPSGCSRAEAIARVTDWLDSFLGAEATRAAARLSTPDERRTAFADLARQREAVLANLAAVLDGQPLPEHTAIDRPAIAPPSPPRSPVPPQPAPITFHCDACGRSQTFTRDELSATSPAGVVPWTLGCNQCGGRARRILARLRNLP